MGKASRSKKGSEIEQRVPETGGPEDSAALKKRGPLEKTVVHMLLIIILGSLAYSNTFNSPFVWDDDVNIVDNPLIKKLDNFILPPGGYKGYLPRAVGHISFALNYYFGGLNVTGYHIVNLSIHIMNAILVYFLVILTFKTPYFRDQESGVWSQGSGARGGKGGFVTVYDSRFTVFIGLFSALFFVLHPIQTQAVTYVVQRFASLATLFYLLSLLMYIKGRLTMEKAGDDMQKATALHGSNLPLSVAFHFLSLAFAVFAMMSKEIAFTLPVMIVLYEVAFFKSSMKRRLLFLAPVALILIVFLVSVFFSGKSFEDMLSVASEITRVQTHMSRWDYLMTQMRVVTTYVRLMVLPVNQNVDYDYPIENSFFTPQVFFSFLFLLALFGLAIYLRWRSRFIAFGILWFFITLSVESSIIPIIDVIFEHRVYLPSVGLIASITTGVFIASHRFKMERAGLTALVLAALLFLGATYARNTVWMSKISLWEDVARKSPGKARVHNNLGVFYSDEGRLDEGVREFQIALEIAPGYAEAHYNLGTVYLEAGRLDEAYREFQAAIKLKPDYANAHNDLGIVYDKTGRVEEAIREYQTALRVRPDYGPALKNLQRHHKTAADKK